MQNDIDVFISYASEDRRVVAKPIARALREAGLKVWFDDQLEVGDLLHRSIDQGLAGSRYGVVILSPDYFAKDWPRRELEGLIAAGKPLLPVWHKVGEKEIAKFSPMVARIKGLVTDAGTEADVEEVARQLLRKIGAPKRGGTVIDLSHRQDKWAWGGAFVPAVERIAADRPILIRDELTPRLAELGYKGVVLLLALPFHCEFGDEVREIAEWVQQGGGLFYFGHYYAPTHHWANPNKLADLLGFRFGNDLLMPTGVTDRDSCIHQAEELDAEYQVLCRPTRAHPILAGVDHLALQSSCSLTNLTIGGDRLQVETDECAALEPIGRMDDGYIRLIHEHRELGAGARTVLGAWEHGKGRVVVAGTWRLATIDDADNTRLIRNAIAWLGGASAS